MDDAIHSQTAPITPAIDPETIAHLEAPLDLKPKKALVWMPQPLLHPVDRIVIRIDPEERIEEITRENNRVVWQR